MEGYSGGQLTFDWEYTPHFMATVYAGPNSTTPKNITKTFTLSSSATGSNETTANVNFGSDYYGGNIDVKATVSLQGRQYTHQLIDVYAIRGEQPTDTAVRN